MTNISQDWFAVAKLDNSTSDCCAESESGEIIGEVFCFMDVVNLNRIVEQSDDATAAGHHHLDDHSSTVVDSIFSEFAVDIAAKRLCLSKVANERASDNIVLEL